MHAGSGLLEMGGVCRRTAGGDVLKVLLCRLSCGVVFFFFFFFFLGVCSHPVTLNSPLADADHSLSTCSMLGFSIHISVLL